MPSRPSDMAPPLIPAWLRRATQAKKDIAGQGFEEIAVASGAAIGALDTLMRQEQNWAGVWRHRLALAAAANTARQMGRLEDEAALRDTVLLTKPGDAFGPAGLLLMAWRRLAVRAPKELLSEANLAAALEEFGRRPGEAAIDELADEVRDLVDSDGTVGARAGALAIAEHHGFGRSFGAWLADALLAQRLGWPHALPLLGTESSLTAKGEFARRPRGMAPLTENENGPEQMKKLLAAQARAALRAIDLAAELDRRAAKLMAVVPKLRAKGAGSVVEKLLSDDAIVASQRIPGISDRGLRRLFDRLVSFGAVRELSGRSVFRIYGL